MVLHRTHVQKLAVLACFEGGVFGPLTLKGHHAGPVRGSVVSTGLNRAITSSKFLKNNLSNRYYSDPYVRGVIYKEASGSLV